MQWRSCVAVMCVLLLPPIVYAQVEDKQLTAKIQAALDKKIAFEFVESPLSDVAAYLSEIAKVDVVLDRRAMEEEGIEGSTPITRNIRGISMRSCLRIALSDLDMTYVIRDGALVLTTKSEAESALQTTVFAVDDIVRRQVDGKTVRDYDELIELITSTVHPETWEEVGGPGAIQVALGSLVVSSTEDVRTEIHLLIKKLRDLRAAIREKPQEVAAVSIDLLENEAAQRIRAALDEKTQANFEEVPLTDIVEFLSDLHNLPFVIDGRALDEVGLGVDTPITFTARDVPLRLALRRMLREIELTTMIDNEVLVLTTPEVAETRLKTRIYPLNDLGTKASEIDFDELVHVLTTNTAPDSWDEVGGPGAIEVFTEPPALIISQTADVHDQVVNLLVELRRNKPNDYKLEKPDPKMFVRIFTLRTAQPMGKSALVDPEDVEKYANIVKQALGEKQLASDGAVVEALDSKIIVRHYPDVIRQVETILFELNVGTFGGGGFGGGGLGGGGYFNTAPQK